VQADHEGNAFQLLGCPMVIKIYEEKVSLARTAAEQSTISLRNAIQNNDRARIIAATGASQFEFLDALTAMPGIV